MRSYHGCITTVYKELGKDYKNHGLQSVNINGRSTSNHRIIANAFTKHFTTIPDMINQNINANYCLLKPLLIIRISFLFL